MSQETIDEVDQLLKKITVYMSGFDKSVYMLQIAINKILDDPVTLGPVLDLLRVKLDDFMAVLQKSLNIIETKIDNEDATASYTKIQTVRSSKKLITVKKEIKDNKMIRTTAMSTSLKAKPKKEEIDTDTDSRPTSSEVNEELLSGTGASGDSCTASTHTVEPIVSDSFVAGTITAEAFTPTATDKPQIKQRKPRIIKPKSTPAKNMDTDTCTPKCPDTAAVASDQVTKPKRKYTKRTHLKSVLTTEEDIEKRLREVEIKDEEPQKDPIVSGVADTATTSDPTDHVQGEADDKNDSDDQ